MSRQLSHVSRFLLSHALVAFLVFWAMGVLFLQAAGSLRDFDISGAKLGAVAANSLPDVVEATPTPIVPSQSLSIGNSESESPVFSVGEDTFFDVSPPGMSFLPEALSVQFHPPPAAPYSPKGANINSDELPAFSSRVPLRLPLPPPPPPLVPPPRFSLSSFPQEDCEVVAATPIPCLRKPDSFPFFGISRSVSFCNADPEVFNFTPLSNTQDLLEDENGDTDEDDVGVVDIDDDAID